jgi:hypothetical protein
MFSNLKGVFEKLSSAQTKESPANQKALDQQAQRRREADSRAAVC